MSTKEYYILLYCATSNTTIIKTITNSNLLDLYYLLYSDTNDKVIYLGNSYNASLKILYGNK